MGKLFLLFTLLPMLELYLLIEIGRWLGGWTTVGLVVVTGMLGAALARAEGLRMLRGWQQAAAQGRLPEDGAIEGGLLLVGGVLLVTPGVITDIVGLSLLLPFTRRLWVQIARARLLRAIERGNVQIMGFGPPPTGPRAGRHRGYGPPPPGVIDVEGESVEHTDGGKAG